MTKINICKGIEMFYSIYELRKLPDLSLSKYQSLEESGVEGVLDKQKAFLRQWQKISSICNIGIHFLIYFNPNEQLEKRIKIFLIYSYDQNNMSSKIAQITKNSPISNFFEFYDRKDTELSRLCENKAFLYKAILKKRERKKISEDEARMPLYLVEGWEAKENARLYDMIRIAEAIEEPICYFVSMYGKDMYTEVEKALSKPINYLRRKVFGRGDSIQLDPGNFDRIRDVAAEETLKCYEKLLDMTVSSPCFQGNIQVYADNALTAQMVLNAAGAEAIEKGDFEIIVLPEKNYEVFPKENIIDYFTLQMPDSLKFWPTLFSLEEIAPFVCFPALYDGENIGMPKETAPNMQPDGIYVGDLPQKKMAYISLKALTKHAFVCGVPGSGKTNTMLHLAISLWNIKKKQDDNIRRVPFLILEPAKREYRELALFDIPELLIFSPSARTQFPFCINPFEFPLGLTLSEHITKLCQVFEGAFPMQPPAPFILDQSIEAIYRKKGWNNSDINDGEKEYPTVSELYEEFERQVLNTTYDSEIQGNIRSVLEMRIGSLVRREKKDIFDVKKSIIRPEEWMEYPIILELEALGKETSNFVTLLICTLIREVLKVNPMGGLEVVEKENGEKIVQKSLRHVIFIEEAHNLIAPQNQIDNIQESNPKIAATECIVDMLKEVRALGEGMIIADQLPTAMALDVIKNTNIKIVHRLTSADDRGMIGNTMSANELQMEQLATYMPGQTLMAYEGLLRPFEMQVCNLEQHGTETPDDDTLYSIMKDKKGQREIRRRFEFRRWKCLQDKIIVVLQLEMSYKKALSNYDFKNRNYNQKEDYIEQCFLKYQGLKVLQQQLQKQYKEITADFIDSGALDRMDKAVSQIGNLYLEEVKKCIETNF